MPDISPLAIVEKGAKLARDVRVGAFSYVGPRVRIAAGCVIDNSATITGRTKMGERNRVYPMAVIGTTRDGEGEGECILGEANSIREHVTIYTRPGETTRIGNDNLIMIGCVVGPGAQLSNHGIFDNCSQIGGGARIGDHVNTSGFASVAPGRSVGPYSFITGYTSVDRDAPPYAILQGFPVRVRGVNTRHLKRCGFGDDDIHAIKAAFRELFNGTNEFINREALDKLLADANPHVRSLAESVMRGRAEGDQ